MRAAVVVLLLSVLSAGCGGGSGPSSTLDASPGSSPAPDASVRTLAIDSQTVRVRVVRVEGAPPFYVEVGPVERAASGEVFGEHDLHVISEWRTPIEVAADDLTVDLSDGVADEGKLGPETTAVLQPEQRTTFTVTLLAGERTQTPGVYETQILIPFWREASQNPSSRREVDEVASIHLQYELVTASQLKALTPFCDQAVPAIQNINGAWQQRGGDPIIPTDAALETIATAARQLDDPRGAQIVDAIRTLNRDLAPWRDDGDTDDSTEQEVYDGSGFSTDQLVRLINELCGTRLHAVGVSA